MQSVYLVYDNDITLQVVRGVMENAELKEAIKKEGSGFGIAYKAP